MSQGMICNWTPVRISLMARTPKNSRLCLGPRPIERGALDGPGRMTTQVLGALGRVSSLQDGQVDVMAGTAYADVLTAKRKGGPKLDPHSSAEAGVRGARQRACLTKEETFYWSSSGARTR